MAMEIVNAWPPNIKEIQKAFNLAGKRPLFAWGNYIFNPYALAIDAMTLYHETTHSIQQDAIGPVTWWKKYLKDKDFRLSQEIPAYQNQYVKFCELNSDWNKRHRYLYALAANMSSDLYGNMVKHSEALTIIKNGN